MILFLMCVSFGKNLPFIPAEFIFGTICLYLWYCEFSILKIAIFVISNVYLLCLFLQVKFQTFKTFALLTLMLLWSDCQLFHCLVCLYVLGMAVQIIWKSKENVWKTCCTWGYISPQQKNDRNKLWKVL